VAGQPAQRTEFEILAPAAAARARESVDLLTPASLPGYSRSSVALMRAGFFFQEQLFADARRELMAAVAADPDEPTLHMLLGQVYDRIGLAELATRELVEARDLSSRRP
jgi:Flp pilus assembly protein TadD